jgi:hypothetical protein
LYLIIILAVSLKNEKDKIHIVMIRNKTSSKFIIFSSILLLAGSLFIGICQCFLLPAFEGLDETAHYSYLSQLVATKKIPNRITGYISNQIDEYAKSAPLIYTYGPDQKQTNVTPKTYSEFFIASDSILYKAKAYTHGHLWQSQGYSSNGFNNWEVQHPPLYYVLMAPLFIATKHLPFFLHFALLRFGSYLLAWLPLAIAVFWFIKNREKVQNAELSAFGIALWPVIIGSWYSDVARLGNDSLCVLWVAIAAIALIGKPTIIRTIILGLALAAGAITKGYFLAIGPSVVIYYLAQWVFVEKKKKQNLYLRASGIVAIIIAIGAGWWYWRCYCSTGYLLGAAAEVDGSHSAGSIKQMFTVGFSIIGIIKSITGIIIAGIMPGTWSLLRPPSIIPLVIILPFFAIFWSYWNKNRHSYLTSTVWQPIWFLAPMLAGLVYHVIILAVSLKAWGQGTGGNYLNILVIPLGMVLGIGLFALFSSRKMSLIILMLLVYDICFVLWMQWANLLAYAGIVTPTPIRHLFGFPQKLPDFLGIFESIRRLDVLSYPKFAIACWIVGLVLEISGLVLLLINGRNLKNQTQTSLEFLK